MPKSCFRYSETIIFHNRGGSLIPLSPLFCYLMLPLFRVFKVASPPILLEDRVQVISRLLYKYTYYRSYSPIRNAKCIGRSQNHFIYLLVSQSSPYLSIHPFIYPAIIYYHLSVYLHCFKCVANTVRPLLLFRV